MKFKLIKDLVANSPFDGEIKLYESGTIFEPNAYDEYIFKGADGNIKTMSKEDLLKRNTLFEVVEDIKLDIKEISSNEEDIIKNFRIQLDVKTSMKKLMEIEKVLKKTINDMLN